MTGGVIESHRVIFDIGVTIPSLWIVLVGDNGVRLGKVGNISAVEAGFVIHEADGVLVILGIQCTLAGVPEVSLGDGACVRAHLTEGDVP